MDLNRKKRTRTIITCAITLAIMAFIFVQSAMPDYASAEESDFFVSIAETIIGAVSTATVDPEALSMVIRKIAHFTEYLVFGASLVLTVRELTANVPAWRRAQKASRKKEDAQKEGTQKEDAQIEGTQKEERKNYSATPLITGIIAWGAGTLYAVTDEFHQYFVPGRCCDWKDMCIDSAGVATGCLLCLLVVLKLTRKTEMGSGTITGT